MANTNRNLIDAKAKAQEFAEEEDPKRDEFYTLLPEIEKELQHYKKHFKGKVVYCNCDDPLESNFFIYFVKHFKELGLKKLITTCYDGSPVAGTQMLFSFAEKEFTPLRVAHKIEVTDVEDFSRTEGKLNFHDVEEALRNGSEKARLEKLEGDKKPQGKGKEKDKKMYGGGDFRSRECVELLKEADIVVTNPPFSLLPEYVAQLLKYKKKFLIIAPLTSITYKDIFPSLRANKIWFGCGIGEMTFNVPRDSKPTKTRWGVDEAGQKWKSMGNVCWLTNLKHKVKKDPLKLTAKYTPEEYPKYDNYDAIYVNTKEIPRDYDGVMGVAVTFFDKYCPEQFEIVGCTYDYGRPDFWPPETKMAGILNGKEMFKCVFIRRKPSS